MSNVFRKNMGLKNKPINMHALRTIYQKKVIFIGVGSSNWPVINECVQSFGVSPAHEDSLCGSGGTGHWLGKRRAPAHLSRVLRTVNWVFFYIV